MLDHILIGPIFLAGYIFRLDHRQGTVIFKSIKKIFIVQSQGKYFLKVDIKWDLKSKKNKLFIGGFSFFGLLKFRGDF